LPYFGRTYFFLFKLDFIDCRICKSAFGMFCNYINVSLPFVTVRKIKSCNKMFDIETDNEMVDKLLGGKTSKFMTERYDVQSIHAQLLQNLLFPTHRCNVFHLRLPFIQDDRRMRMECDDCTFHLIRFCFFNRCLNYFLMSFMNSIKKTNRTYRFSQFF